MSTTMTRNSIPKSSTTSGWGVYNNDSGQLVFVGMSRSQARDYRNEFEDASHLTGPRKISISAKLV
jgi:hypothetical protein